MPQAVSFPAPLPRPAAPPGAGAARRESDFGEAMRAARAERAQDRDAPPAREAATQRKSEPEPAEPRAESPTGDSADADPASPQHGADTTSHPEPKRDGHDMMAAAAPAIPSVETPAAVEGVVTGIAAATNAGVSGTTPAMSPDKTPGVNAPPGQGPGALPKATAAGHAPAQDMTPAALPAGSADDAEHPASPAAERAAPTGQAALAATAAEAPPVSPQAAAAVAHAGKAGNASGSAKHAADPDEPDGAPDRRQDVPPEAAGRSLPRPADEARDLTRLRAETADHAAARTAADATPAKPAAAAPASPGPSDAHHAQPAVTAALGHGSPTAGPDGARAAPAPLAAGSSAMQPPAQQIAVHIARAVQEGNDRLTVHLKPAALGRISIDLEVRHDHRVVAVIAADRSDTLDLLQRDARTLERALNDAGLKTDSGSLSFNLHPQGQNARQDGRDALPNLFSGGYDAPAEDGPGPALPTAAYARAWGAGQIDIRV